MEADEISVIARLICERNLFPVFGAGLIGIGRYSAG